MQAVPGFDAKGIETVRRDTCPAVAKTMERSLRLLFATRDLSEVMPHTHTSEVVPHTYLYLSACCSVDSEWSSSGQFQCTNRYNAATNLTMKQAAVATDIVPVCCSATLHAPQVRLTCRHLMKLSHLAPYTLAI